MTALLDGIDYTTNQASYDMAPLRLNGLIDRVPGKNRNRLTSDGLRFAIVCTKLHDDRLLRPLLAADQPPATNTKSITHHRRSHRRTHRQRQTAAQRSLKTHDKSQRPRDQGSLRRRRDCARQRWPFGQHKITACLVAWTAMPESLRLFRWWSRPMVSCRDEVSALTTTVAAQSVPRDANALWPGSDEDLRWRPGASLACHFARSITNKLSKVDPQVESRSSSG